MKATSLLTVLLFLFMSIYLGGCNPHELFRVNSFKYRSKTKRL